MKMTTALNGICGMCANDLNGRPPHFFLPIPDRSGQLGKSKEVCPDCFSKYLNDHVPDTVMVQSGPPPSEDWHDPNNEPCDQCLGQTHREDCSTCKPPTWQHFDFRPDEGDDDE